MTITLIDKLIRLCNGEALPLSALNSELIEALDSDGAITRQCHGTRRTISAYDADLLRHTLNRMHPGLGDLERMRTLMQDKQQDSLLRSRQAAETGNSKLVKTRVFNGFLVNTYHPLNCQLNGEEFIINPAEGAMMFVYDWQSFKIPDDTVIVGVENAENFRYIRQQKGFFDSILPDTELLFVSRYPQEQSHDLREWLKSISNHYVHFGDLDLAGINIYMTEYFQHLGIRASFLIPPDYEERISNGSLERYECQYKKFKNMQIADPRLRPLVECIHRHHRCYDQEGYIGINEKPLK